MGALVNAGTTGDVIEVRSVYARPHGGEAQAPLGFSNSNIGILAVTRITGMSGGTPILGSQHNTSTAGLPTALVVARYPEVITPTGLDMRRLGDCATFSPLLQTSVVTTPWVGQRRLNDVYSVIGDSSGTIEPIILAAGEGIAITQRVFGIRMMRHYEVLVTNDTTGTTATYAFDAPSGAGTESAVIAVMNGVSSTSSVSVRAITFPIYNQDNYILNIGVDGQATRALRLIDGVVVPEARTDEQTATAFDTSRPLPPFVQCVAGPFRSRLVGESAGLPVDWYSTHTTLPALAQSQLGRLRRNYYCFSQDNTDQLNPSVPMLFPRDHDMLYRADPNGEGIVLLPGTGLCVSSLDDDASMTFDSDVYEIEFLFTAYRSSAPVISASYVS